MEPGLVEDQAQELQLEVAYPHFPLHLDLGQHIKMYVGESLAMNMGVQMPSLTGGTIGTLIHPMSTGSVSLMVHLVTTSGPMLLA